MATIQKNRKRQRIFCCVKRYQPIWKPYNCWPANLRTQYTVCMTTWRNSAQNGDTVAWLRIVYVSASVGEQLIRVFYISQAVINL